MLAFHQSAHIRSLADGGSYEVTWVVEEALSPERKALGWSVPDAGKARVIVSPDAQKVEALIDEQPEESIHIFSGLHDASLVSRALQRCIPVPTTIGLMSEAYDHRGWKGWCRSWRGKVGALRLARRVDFVLAMGKLGQEWFCRAGFPSHKVFPYGYFTETPCVGNTIAHSHPSPGPVRLLYVGQCVQRKGVDVLLRALATQPGDWQLQIVGQGDQQEALRALRTKLGLDDRVTFLSVLPNPSVMALLQRSDLLILPSRFDGWGAVVNEALLRGTPVVCTDKCGAADLLQASWQGDVVPVDSVQALGETLKGRIQQGRQTPGQRERLCAWASSITGEAAAGYVSQVLAHVGGTGPRPTPPWYDIPDNRSSMETKVLRCETN
ncbi:MAG: glycosyltransferase family 4 protein [Armatimonadota bacterium]